MGGVSLEKDLGTVFTLGVLVALIPPSCPLKVYEDSSESSSSSYLGII